MYVSKFVSEPLSSSMTDTAVPIEIYTKLTLSDTISKPHNKIVVKYNLELNFTSFLTSAKPLSKNYWLKQYKAILSWMIKMWFNPFPAFLEGLRQDCECTCIVTTHAFNKYCTVSKFLSKWQMATIYFHFNLVLLTLAWEFLQSIDNISFTNVMW